MCNSEGIILAMDIRGIIGRLDQNGCWFERPSTGGNFYSAPSSLGFSFPLGVPIKEESSDEKDGVRTPSRIWACVKGDRPRVAALDAFFFRDCWMCCSVLGLVLPRRGRPLTDDLDGGRSSVSTGVVLRDGVREWDSERGPPRRKGDLDSRASFEILDEWWW